MTVKKLMVMLEKLNSDQQIKYDAGCECYDVHEITEDEENGTKYYVIE